MPPLPHSPLARRSRRGARAQGFSLVETLIACALLALVGLGIGTSQIASRRLLEESRERDYAVQLLRTEMNNVMVRSVDELTSEDSPYVIGGEIQIENPELRDQTLTFTTPDYQDGDPQPSLLNVELVLDWTTNSGNERTLRLSTILR